MLSIFRQEFCIVPTVENERNKSPVIYREHNLGLEAWCVKYVYNYAHTYLMNIKSFIAKNSLTAYVKTQLNKALIGALLVRPESTTFWNVRRELVEKGIININRELLFSKLILSHKNKSNETFAYRRWIIGKLLKRNDNSLEYCRTLLNNEFFITELTAERASNNYHAWSHRLWALQNLGSQFFKNVLMSELEFSYNWILKHVSEHAGYHYRQNLISLIKSHQLEKSLFRRYYKYLSVNFIKKDLKVNSLLELLFYNCTKYDDPLENYFCMLLFELVSTLRHITCNYPDHEALWYYHRFIIFSLMDASGDYLNVTWRQKVAISETVEENENITSINLNSKLVDHKFQENGESFPKLLKCEFNDLESTKIFQRIIEEEKDFIRYHLTSKNEVESFLVKRHLKWLRVILGIKDI